MKDSLFGYPTSTPKAMDFMEIQATTDRPSGYGPQQSNKPTPFYL